MVVRNLQHEPLKCLSSGTMKRCYVGSEPDKVFLIPFNKNGQQNLKKEIDYLKYLKKVGLPVVNIGNPILYHGKSGFQELKLKPDTLVKAHLPNQFLSLAHIPNMPKQLDTLIKILDREQLLIEDLQFMLDKEDRLVIIDPFAVIKLDPTNKVWFDVLEENNRQSRSFNRKRNDFLNQQNALTECMNKVHLGQIVLAPVVVSKKRKIQNVPPVVQQEKIRLVKRKHISPKSSGEKTTNNTTTTSTILTRSKSMRIPVTATSNKRISTRRKK